MNVILPHRLLAALLHFTVFACAVPLDHSVTHSRETGVTATRDNDFGARKNSIVDRPVDPWHPTDREEWAYYLVGDIRRSYDDDQTEKIADEDPGDGITRSRVSSSEFDDQKNARASGAARGHDKRSPRPWPDGIVPYKLQEDYPNWLLDLIRRAMEELETEVSGTIYSSVWRISRYERSSTCIRFREKSIWEKHYLVIRDEGSCHASLGFNAKPVLSISPHCARLGTLKHQLLHVLGFQHEHTRPDRERFVNVHWDNVASEAEFRLRSWGETEMEIPYDFESILHFGPYTGSKDSLFPSLTPRREQEASTLNFGQILHLSSKDVYRVQRFYGCKETRPSLSQTPRILLSCKFENGPCGFLGRSELNGNAQFIGEKVGGDALWDNEINTYDPGEKLAWTAVSDTAPDGPAGGSNTGLDPYFYVSGQLQRWVDSGDISVVDTITRGHIDRVHHKNDERSSKVKSFDEKYGGISADLAILLGISGNSEGPEQPRTASAFSPFFTPSSETDAFCVTYQLLQTDPQGGFTLILHSVKPPKEYEMAIPGAANQRAANSSEVLDDYDGIVIEGWSWSGVTVQSNSDTSYRLELRATITGGSVAVDDILVLEGPCV